MFASVTSDYQQPLAQISTTARHLTEEVCSVILSKKETTLVNVLMSLILGFQVTYSAFLYQDLLQTLRRLGNSIPFVTSKWFIWSTE